MRALLLSAGYGTRLQPITFEIPKCLVDINGRPLLDYWLELLDNSGINKVLINTHYLSGLVENYVKSSKYSRIITTVYEDELLHTGGTVIKNKDFFEGEPIILIHADNLSNFNLKKFCNRFATRDDGIEITMMTFRTDVPESCGIVNIDNKGIVTSFHEKTKNNYGNLANGAVYILSKNVVEFMEKLDKKVIDFSNEVLPFFIGKINTYENDIYHRDIGTIENLNLGRLEYLSLMNKNEVAPVKHTS